MINESSTNEMRRKRNTERGRAIERQRGVPHRCKTNHAGGRAAAGEGREAADRRERKK